MSYASRWLSARPPAAAPDGVPAELVALDERIRALPPRLRRDLEPIIAEAIEQAQFRDRVLGVAREALDRLRVELESTRFDRDMTRQERDELRRLLALRAG